MLVAVFKLLMLAELVAVLFLVEGLVAPIRVRFAKGVVLVVRIIVELVPARAPSQI